MTSSIVAASAENNRDCIPTTARATNSHLLVARDNACASARRTTLMSMVMSPRRSSSGPEPDCDGLSAPLQCRLVALASGLKFLLSLSVRHRNLPSFPTYHLL